VWNIFSNMLNVAAAMLAHANHPEAKWSHGSARYRIPSGPAKGVQGVG
jgi:hypothetical protein